MQFREPYNFEKNDEVGEEEEDVSVSVDTSTKEEVYENEEEEEESVSVGEDAPTEEEEVELDESLPIFNFASCTSDELIEFMLDFLDLADEEELLQFCIIYLAAAAAEAEEEVEAAEIAAWAEETAWMSDVDGEDD